MQKSSKIHQFISQMLWAFKQETPADLFRTLKKYELSDSVDKIKTEMLVVNSSNDRVSGSCEQCKVLYDALSSPKTCLESTEAESESFANDSIWKL